MIWRISVRKSHWSFYSAMLIKYTNFANNFNIAFGSKQQSYPLTHWTVLWVIFGRISIQFFAVQTAIFSTTFIMRVYLCRGQATRDKRQVNYCWDGNKIKKIIKPRVSKNYSTTWLSTDHCILGWAKTKKKFNCFL